MYLRFQVGSGSFDETFERLLIVIRPCIQRMISIYIIMSGYAGIGIGAVKTEGVFFIGIGVRFFLGGQYFPAYAVGVNGQEIPLIAVKGKADFADFSRVGPEIGVGARRGLGRIAIAAPFYIKFQTGFFRRFGRNDVDDPAHGAGTVFGTRRTLDDFNVIHVFCADTL